MKACGDEYQQFLSEQIDILEQENAALCLTIEELQTKDDKPATVDYPAAAIIPTIIFTPEHYGFRTDLRMALSPRDMMEEFGKVLYLITRMVGNGTYRGDSIKAMAKNNDLKILSEILRLCEAPSKQQYYDMDRFCELRSVDQKCWPNPTYMQTKRSI